MGSELRTESTAFQFLPEHQLKPCVNEVLFQFNANVAAAVVINVYSPVAKRSAINS